MKKKGFTLIELLAVIVILAIIALITIPVVGNIIENSRKEAFKRSVESLSREYEYKEVQTDTKLGEVDACTLQDPCKIEGTIKRDTNGEVVLYVTDGRYCTNGKVGAFTVVNGTCGIGSGIEEITFNNPNYEVNYSKNNQVIDITPNGGSGDFTYTKLSEKNSLNEDTNYVEVNDSTLIVKPSISVGTYIVSVRIKDNETQLEKEVNIVIEIESVNISNIEIDDIESIDYDGTEQTPEVVVISNGSILEKDVDYEVEYINSINAGTATIKITGKGNYVGEITKTFTINKVNAPNTSVVGASLDYNGLNQSLITSVNVSNSHIYYSVGTPLNSSNYLTLGSETKPTRSDAGTYTVYYYAPADNYNEVSGSVTVTINPITLNIPPQPSDKNYTGSSQNSGITCPTGSTASGSISEINAGTYTQTCTLTNGNYKWNDNTTTPKNITWIINPISINIPSQPSDKNYTGGSQVSGITCPTGSTASGDTSATYPGTYTQTCTLNNGNYKWNDNTTTPKSVTWVIQGVAEVGTCNTLTYNGNSQTLAQGGEHVTYVNNSGVNAGDYTVTVNAEEGFKFIDGTTSKTLSCKINKANLSLNIDKKAWVVVAYLGIDTTYTITGDGIGSLSCSIDQYYATCRTEGNKVIINGNKAELPLPYGYSVLQYIRLNVTASGDENHNSLSTSYSTVVMPNMDSSMCPGCVYASSEGGTFYFDTAITSDRYTTDYRTLKKPIFLGLKLDSSNKIEKIYICKSSEMTSPLSMYCITPGGVNANGYFSNAIDYFDSNMSKVRNSGDICTYEEKENSRETNCHSYGGNNNYIYIYKYDGDRRYQADLMITTRFRNQDACYIYGHYFSSDKPYARCS